MLQRCLICFGMYYLLFYLVYFLICNSFSDSFPYKLQTGSAPIRSAPIIISSNHNKLQSVALDIPNYYRHPSPINPMKNPVNIRFLRFSLYLRDSLLRAGSGNRTRLSSLGSWHTTDVLYLRVNELYYNRKNGLCKQNRKARSYHRGITFRIL